MEDFSAPRIEPSAQSTDLDQRSRTNASPRKRQSPEKTLPSPSLESGDPAEDIHQVDELA